MDKRNIFDFWKQALSREEFEVIKKIIEREMSSYHNFEYNSHLFAEIATHDNDEIILAIENCEKSKNKIKNFKNFRLLGENYSNGIFKIILEPKESVSKLWLEWQKLINMEFKDFFDIMDGRSRNDRIKNLKMDYGFDLIEAAAIVDANEQT